MNTLLLLIEDCANRDIMKPIYKLRETFQDIKISGTNRVCVVFYTPVI